MKNKQNRYFKIIPFCISLLMVLLITGGVGYYTVFIWNSSENPENVFLNKYYDPTSEDNKNLSTGDYLDRMLEFEYKGFYDVCDQADIALSYRNPKDGKEYVHGDTSTKNYYKNNVMHIDQYFDIELKALVTETEFNGKVTTEIKYEFYFYNINHTNEDLDLSKVSIVVVDGKTKEDASEDQNHLGDGLLDLYFEEEDALGAMPIANTSYNSYPIYDKGATINKEEMDIVKNQVSIYSCSLNSGYVYTYVDDAINGQAKDFQDLNGATFCIYLEGEDEEEPTKLVEGTFDKIKEYKDFNEVSLHKGYNKEYYKVPVFFGYTWHIILISVGISFIISFVLASLFYMIWIDDKKPAKKNVNNKQTNNK